MGYDEYTDAEFEKLKRLVTDMKTPLYPSCNEKYTKFFSSLELLQLKATYHWTDQSFKSLLDLLRDMLPKGNKIPKTTYEAKQNTCIFALWGWRWKKYMLVKMTASCSVVIMQI